MFENYRDNASAKKDQLLKLSVRQIRLEAKNSSINLYSRKTKKELIELLLKEQKRLLIENQTNDDVDAEEERIALEKAKAEEKNFHRDLFKSMPCSSQGFVQVHALFKSTLIQVHAGCAD